MSPVCSRLLPGVTDRKCVVKTVPPGGCRKLEPPQIPVCVCLLTLCVCSQLTKTNMIGTHKIKKDSSRNVQLQAINAQKGSFREEITGLQTSFYRYLFQNLDNVDTTAYSRHINNSISATESYNGLLCKQGHEKAFILKIWQMVSHKNMKKQCDGETPGPTRLAQLP